MISKLETDIFLRKEKGPSEIPRRNLTSPMNSRASPRKTPSLSLVHKSPLRCPQVSITFSKIIYYTVHKSPLLDKSGEVMLPFTEDYYKCLKISTG